MLSSCSNTCFLPKFVGQKSLMHWTALKHPQDHSCGSLTDLCNVYQTLILGSRMDFIPVCCILVPVTSIFHSEATIVTEPIVPGTSTVAGIPGLPLLNLKLTSSPFNVPTLVKWVCSKVVSSSLPACLAPSSQRWSLGLLYKAIGGVVVWNGNRKLDKGSLWSQ